MWNKPRASPAPSPRSVTHWDCAWGNEENESPNVANNNREVAQDHLRGSRASSLFCGFDSFTQAVRDTLCLDDAADDQPSPGGGDDNNHEHQPQKDWMDEALERRDHTTLTIQHRTNKLGGQAKRLTSLQNNMFYSGQYYIQRTKSFDDKDNIVEIRMKKDSTKGGLPDETQCSGIAVDSATSREWLCGDFDIFEPVSYDDKRGQENARSNKYVTSELVNADDDDICYDSDIGDARQCQRNPRAIFCGAKASLGDEQQQRFLFGNGESLSRLVIPREKMSDENLLVDLKSHRRIPLIWHPSKNQANSSRSSLQYVAAWIEFGSKLQSTLVQPKFIWVPAYQPALQRKRLNAHAKVNAIDLLDICRIAEESEKIDRSQFPFARKSNSFSVHTICGDAYLFEVQDSLTRENVVRGLKLLVAELASMVASGYGYMEYFTAPSLLIEKNIKKMHKTHLCEAYKCE